MCVCLKLVLKFLFGTWSSGLSFEWYVILCSSQNLPCRVDSSLSGNYVKVAIVVYSYLEFSYTNHSRTTLATKALV